MKALNIVSTAYRATLEEQDDTIVWLTHAMKGAGADVAMLLRGNAVNYAVAGQDASGLSFGAERQTQPPRLAEDVAQLVATGVAVFVVSDDLTARGIRQADCISGLTPISRTEVPALLEKFERVWNW
jgi:hypothetical protein